MLPDNMPKQQMAMHTKMVNDDESDVQFWRCRESISILHSFVSSRSSADFARDGESVWWCLWFAACMRMRSERNK